jgi:hypothetical protein
LRVLYGYVFLLMTGCRTLDMVRKQRLLKDLKRKGNMS